MADKLFVIAIGGTGMRCLESFVHLCAIGMFDNEEIERDQQHKRRGAQCGHLLLGENKPSPVLYKLHRPKPQNLPVAHFYAKCHSRAEKRQRGFGKPFS